MSGTPIRLVVMGVAGAGKTTVGERIAEALDLPFQDADALHPPENVARMRSGVPLEDADRLPWLAVVGQAVADATTGSVMACSALRRGYRDVIRTAAPDAVFVHLTADPGLLAERIGGRAGHYMPASLLSSQLAALEPLETDERGFAVDNRLPLDSVVDAVLRGLSAVDAVGAIPIPAGGAA